MAFMYYRAADSGHKDVYAALPLINNERLKIDSTTPFIPSYVKRSVTRSSDPVQAYASRVQGRQILLENPARDSKAKKEREGKRAQRAAERVRKAVGVVSKKESRKRGLWKLQKDETNFELFLPLHSLWLGYMSELLSLSLQPAVASTDPASAMPSAAGMHAKLIKADFHGSIVTVRQSKNPCLVGLSGIVIHETENAFKVITQKNQLKMLPKQNSIFVFAVPLYAAPASPSTGSPKTILDIPHIEFELYGNHFCYRAAERAGRKFKHKETIEL
ncbi:RNase P/MRP, p29 subunit [Lentinus tigrinus ALCF2SS1-7]|uniref:Ribonuclease P protein subunit n=1 Tax=Lentinus tigrinus ALCF2SS1-6 TaxID=1328759 RepID=A0A5C2SRK8_9APHY|nr:RNase P/MRP, p29 subunit [Lentinus tigrinus ALCF2SS1-6]RPD79981.1 RNase P/MRP, p29 subunit [Lentinus tigrinus ALCF2SS1-7]